MRRFIGLLALGLGACTAGSPGVDAGEPIADAGVRDGSVVDPGPDGGATPADSGVMPPADAAAPALAVGDGVRVAWPDGRTDEAELVAVYDHRIWWEPEDTSTYALFSADRFGAFPDDRSFAFVSPADVTVTRLSRAPTPGYEAVLRARGLVVGGVPLTGRVQVITGNESYHREENGYGDFAWDLVRTDETGRRFTGDGTRNEDFLVWGDEVRLPRAGYVVEVVRDVPDNLQPGRASTEGGGNLIGIHIGGAYYVYLLHFRLGTIPEHVVVGAELPRGELLGLVGNSGTSLEPHLHVTMLWYDTEAERTWSVPSEMTDIYVSETATGTAQRRDYVVPRTGQWISNDP